MLGVQAKLHGYWCILIGVRLGTGIQGLDICPSMRQQREQSRRVKTLWSCSFPQ